ncbi:MAG: formate--tetrahydrofolate ligase [Steroidobacteraceae bacterium]
MAPPASNIEIAQQAKMLPIVGLAKDRLGIPEESPGAVRSVQGQDLPRLHRHPEGQAAGQLILVTAISPTPAGEGKTTTTVGLGDALNRIGKKTIICLREPALGPVFGMKGGAAGGGYSQVVPDGGHQPALHGGFRRHCARQQSAGRAHR